MPVKNADEETVEDEDVDPKTGRKRPFSPIDKSLLYMGAYDNFIKKQGRTPKIKFDEIVVNNADAMQILLIIGKRYKKINRVDEGNEVLRKLRNVFFPSTEDIAEENQSKFNRQKQKFDKRRQSQPPPLIADPSGLKLYDSQPSLGFV